MSFKYNFDGSEKSLSEMIRHFSTEDVLKSINNESNTIFNNKKNDMPGAENVKFTLYEAKSKKSHIQKAIIQSWSLIDLAYYSVLYSNDYRGKCIEDKAELYLLTMVVDEYKENTSEFKTKNLEANTPEIMLYLWGFGGEQFKLEQPGKVFDVAARELYIIFESSKQLSNKYDFEKIVREEMGISWQNVLAYLLILWFGFTKYNTVQQLFNDLGNSDFLYIEELRNVVDYYSADYEEIRKSPIGRQIFYTKPFVKTSRKEIVSLSPFLNLSIYEHSIFWIIRNYFQKQDKDKQGFVNYFGECFEQYFYELLDDCLCENEFRRINEEKEKRADWKIEIEDYIFLIEQKASVMMIKAKQQLTSIETIKDFSCKTIVEALEQLKKTESIFTQKNIIKIVLLYEDYLKPEILDSIFRLPECKIENDGYYWLVTIDEMERLLCLAKTDRSCFIDVIEEKIDREIHHYIKGKSIGQILEEKGLFKNSYLEREHIKHYRDVATQNVRSLLLNRK